MQALSKCFWTEAIGSVKLYKPFYQYSMAWYFHGWAIKPYSTSSLKIPHLEINHQYFHIHWVIEALQYIFQMTKIRTFWLSLVTQDYENSSWQHSYIQFILRSSHAHLDLKKWPTNFFLPDPYKVFCYIKTPNFGELNSHMWGC